MYTCNFKRSQCTAKWQSAGTVRKQRSKAIFWFDIWRMGVYPKWNEGVQFPKASVSQFFREMTPDLSDHRQDVPAINALADKIGASVLVTHSAGGFPGWMVAMQNKTVKAVAASVTRTGECVCKWPVSLWRASTSMEGDLGGTAEDWHPRQYPLLDARPQQRPISRVA